MKIGLQTWGSEGDVRPFLALAGGLRTAGHEVTLVITSVENKDYGQYGRDKEFAVLQVGQRTYDDEALRHLADKILHTWNPISQIKLLFDHTFNPVIPEMFEASQKICRENDIVIGHFLHHPLHTASEKANTPYVSVSLNHGLIISRYSTIYGLPDFTRWMNPFLLKCINVVFDRVFGHEINALRKSVDLPTVNNVFSMIGKSRLNLLAMSSALCRRQPDWPGYHEICGFLELRETSNNWTMPKGLKKFIESGPLPVYMTIGSMMSVDTTPKIMTEILVQGALLAGCRAIIQSRWDEFPNFPDHQHIYKIQKAPHEHIFPHCAAVVHHGGAGTTHSATRYGCPSVVIEYFADQPLFALELKRLGVAPDTLHRRNISAKKLASAIRTVLDTPGMKRRAEELGSFMQKENGVTRAVELIEGRFGAL